jgi:hypothetical protein
MPELGSYGSVRGAAGNSRPYRDWRPHGGGAADTRGRRTQTSKGGNRGRCGEAARQSLWGFRRWRSVAEVSWGLVRRATDGVRRRAGRLRWGEPASRCGNGTTRRLSRAARQRAWSWPVESRRSRSVALGCRIEPDLIMMCRS